MKKTSSIILSLGIVLLVAACQSENNKGKTKNPVTDTTFSGAKGEVVLMTLDPGHFHASLVQKYRVPQISPKAYVYAPKGPDVKRHLDRIRNFNARKENPTDWEEKIYTGADFLDKMINQKPGNIVVISGNNAKKTTYINKCVKATLNVLADKPMVIEPKKYPMLENAFLIAKKNNVLLYDIMTERYEITNILQKDLSHIPAVFGELLQGSVDEPSVVKSSVHHWFKHVAGNPIKRPPWFFDESQQGEAIVGVSTHLIDLVQLACMPKEIIKKSDVELINAHHWTTPLALDQFTRITRLEEWPGYLEKELKEDTLHVYSNGVLNYTINDIHAKVQVEWHYEAPEGGGDTHYSIMRGSKSNLVIRQGKEQDYKPELYIELMADDEPAEFAGKLNNAINEELGYDDISIVQTEEKLWRLDIPDHYRVGHEAHFKQVTEKYLQYLVDGEMPEWEKSYMIVKYYLTMEALNMARNVVGSGKGSVDIK